MKKEFVIGIATMLILLSVTILQIIISNSLSTKGIALSGIEAEIDSYKKENMQLNEKILFSSSLTHVASAAAAMGFSPEKDVVDISGVVPIAIKE